MEAARRGLRVTLVERQTLGGTCVNRGCIPSKYFLSKANFFSQRPGEEPPSVMAHLQRQKNAIVDTLRQRMQQALKSSRITWAAGSARIASSHSIELTAPDGRRATLEADFLLLAAGTQPLKPKMFPDHAAVLDSTSALDLDQAPARLVVLGGGYIGCELACAFQGLGSQVTLIEKEPRLLPAQSEFEAASMILQRAFEKRNLRVWTGTAVHAVVPQDERRLQISCSNGETLEADALLLALGRAPRWEELGLEQAGLSLTGGRLSVNGQMQTAAASVYAIGDLVSPVPLAHVAAREGEIAVAHMCGENQTIDYTQIPRCVYTWPEAAAVGLTEAQARQAGYTPRTDRYHFAANAKALVEEQAEGFWAVVSEADGGKILGAQIVGAHATELIHLVSLSLKAGLRAQDIADTVFAHPTLSEGFPEAMKRSRAPRMASEIRSPGPA